MNTPAANVLARISSIPANPNAELDRLGDEIAELSAHLEAATARLLDLIREFDARQGWSNGFTSCAHWLSWRVGLDPGAAREKVRDARDRRVPAGRRARRHCGARRAHRARLAARGPNRGGAGNRPPPQEPRAARVSG